MLTPVGVAIAAERASRRAAAHFAAGDHRLRGPRPPAAGWRGIVGVIEALGVGAAVALELRLDPIDGGAVAIGALTAVAELASGP